MGAGSSVTSKNKNTVNNTSSDQYLSLDLYYIDKQSIRAIDGSLRFKPTDTIRTIVEEFLKPAENVNINPDKTTLVSMCLGGQCFSVPEKNSNMTLNALKIQQGSLLCFEPREIGNRCNLIKLILFLPNDMGRKIVHYDDESTVIDVVHHVIECLRGKYIELNQVQLFTFNNQHLNQLHNLYKKLKSFNFINYSSIYVNISDSNSLYSHRQEISVSVISTLYDKISFYASHTDTLSDLNDQIMRRFPQCYHVYIEFFDRNNELLNSHYQTKLMRWCSSKSDTTITALCKESLPDNLLNTLQQHDKVLESTSLLKSSDIVYVKLEFVKSQPITIEVPITYTGMQVKNTAMQHQQNQTTSQIRLYTPSHEIDNQQLHQRLIDIGIKPKDTIVAKTMPISSEVTSTRNITVDLSKTNSRNRRMVLKPHGLANLGNTCFMNSALQCLFYVTPLTKFFLDGFEKASNLEDDSSDYNNPFDSVGEMTSAYAELLWSMCEPDDCHSSSPLSIRPLRMKQTIGRLGESFSTSEQQDAQEFIICLLDAINDEFKGKNKPDTNTIIKQVFFGRLCSEVTCLECGNLTSSTNWTSFLPLSINYQERTFIISFLTNDGEQTNSVIQINPNKRIASIVDIVLRQRNMTHLYNRIIAIGTQSQEKLEFDMPLKDVVDSEITFIEQEQYANHPPNYVCDIEHERLHLGECIRGFVSVEQLDNAFFCQQATCKKKTSVTKQLQFLSLPPVIIMQLKRFSCTKDAREKLTTFVNFPVDGLDLSILLSKSSSKTDEAFYNLIGVCNHIGSISSGHYTAYVRDLSKTQTWYEFDDMRIWEIDPKREVVTSDAYLLFYMRQKR